jgi:hypothetical protein
LVVVVRPARIRYLARGHPPLGLRQPPVLASGRSAKPTGSQLRGNGLPRSRWPGPLLPPWLESWPSMRVEPQAIHLHELARRNDLAHGRLTE